jgi:GMP synthase-like glutamine amidotransferase
MSAGNGAGPLRALVIQHEQPTPGGYVHQWLDERRADQEVFRIDVEDRHVEPADFDMIVSLGSEFAAFDDSIPWIEREMRLLQTAADVDVPILGICFGGQLLARALGGESYRGEESEIGWLAVQTREESMVPEGPWFQWHFDTFTPPPGAKLIAKSSVGPQAYTIGRSLGLQFHPEVTPEIMDSWVAVYRHELDQEGIDPERLLEETHQRANDSRASAWRLFDAFLSRAAGRRERTRGR